MVDGDYFPFKMKRKNLEHFNDDFSDFSLSSPATKIRRLDAELPPIIEEEEMEVPIVEQSVRDQSSGKNAGVVIEELTSVPENEERAIVLFKPINSPIVSSPPNFSVALDSQFISGFKSRVLWSNQSNSFRGADEKIEADNDSGARDHCMAVVPWVRSQKPFTPGAEVPSQTESSDMMDDEGTETVTMDVENQNVDFEHDPVNESNGANLNGGIHQWQQQHCMTLQPPHNASTPVVWYQ